MCKNASQSITIQLQCPKIHYGFVTNQARFFESWNSWPSFEQFKYFDPNSQLAYELQELTTDCMIQLRSSQTEYVSATNPNICQFVTIRGIRALCGIGV